MVKSLNQFQRDAFTRHGIHLESPPADRKFVWFVSVGHFLRCSLYADEVYTKAKNPARIHSQEVESVFVPDLNRAKIADSSQLPDDRKCQRTKQVIHFLASIAQCEEKSRLLSTLPQTANHENISHIFPRSHFTIPIAFNLLLTYIKSAKRALSRYVFVLPLGFTLSGHCLDLPIERTRLHVEPTHRFDCGNAAAAPLSNNRIKVRTGDRLAAFVNAVGLGHGDTLALAL